MSIPRRLLVPIDFGPLSDGAIDLAVALARKLEGYIVLLHAIEPVHDLTGSLSAAVTGAYDEAAEHTARMELAKLAETLRLRGVPVSVAIERGRAWRVIVDTARKLDMDLIVMATHGASRAAGSAVGRALQARGSVARKVVRTASCPVATVPELSTTSEP